MALLLVMEQKDEWNIIIVKLIDRLHCYHIMKSKVREKTQLSRHNPNRQIKCAWKENK